MSRNVKSQIALVTNSLDTSEMGGREQLCRLNHNLLNQIFGERCHVLELTKESVLGLVALFATKRSMRFRVGNQIAAWEELQR